MTMFHFNIYNPCNEEVRPCKESESMLSVNGGEGKEVWEGERRPCLTPYWGLVVCVSRDLEGLVVRAGPPLADMLDLCRAVRTFVTSPPAQSPSGLMLLRELILTFIHIASAYVHLGSVRRRTAGRPIPELEQVSSKWEELSAAVILSLRGLILRLDKEQPKEEGEGWEEWGGGWTPRPKQQQQHHHHQTVTDPAPLYSPSPRHNHHQRWKGGNTGGLRYTFTDPELNLNYREMSEQGRVDLKRKMLEVLACLESIDLDQRAGGGTEGAGERVRNAVQGVSREVYRDVHGSAAETLAALGHQLALLSSSEPQGGPRMKKVVEEAEALFTEFFVRVFGCRFVGSTVPPQVPPRRTHFPPSPEPPRRPHRPASYLNLSLPSESTQI